MKIEVLLSTFNGERHLEELLESVAAQDHDDFSLLVRDDGSTDATREILENWSRKDSRIRLVTGENLGFARSYLELVERSEKSADAFAFCDQDDIWLPHKLRRAADALAGCNGEPVLYGCRLIVADAEGNPVVPQPVPSKPLGFGHALVECGFGGCATVFNAALRDLVAGRRPRHVFYHDWWLYLVASALGRVVYDAEPGILYRRHGANASSLNLGRYRDTGTKIARWFRYAGQHPVRRQAAEFNRLYGELVDAEKRHLLETFAGPAGGRFKRLELARRGAIYRQSNLDQRFLYLLLIFDQL